MADRNDGSPEAVATAETTFDAAVVAMHRQEVAAELRSRNGLHYASIGDDRLGPNLVAYNGQILGETHTTSPGAFRDWYATPLDSKNDLGPFPTARAAAAALKRGAVAHHLNPSD
ncbi:hypothetical protein [Streptomyces sp. NPDC127197]|uniref:hypothetical protein n=1 Tax=Streptomyces sp. NPDC127197 TaxID=3345388 RepID=UPI00363A18B2